MEYCVIDCTNELVYGPYQTLNEAYAQADAFPVWEIVNGNGDLVDWSRGFAQNTANAKAGAHAQEQQPQTAAKKVLVEENELG
jgi:hypothetical protein